MTELVGDGRRGAAIARLVQWRQRLPASPGRTLFVLAVAGVMALPLATVAVLSFSPQESVWPHLIRTVLPGALADTGLLLVGVAALTLLFGTGTAWLVTMYRFPGRGLLDRLLVLPLAMPTYITAYAYVELLDFSGPVQRALRALFGWLTVKD
ncbi:MAG TPA: hypothetical protein VL176_10030, partial [Steroidobacteraceae bacterium]|nr:hypothetical protein [Steroidobacteraceae bacterium]